MGNMKTIYELVDGKFVQVAKPKSPNKAHFRIMWGDSQAWSPLQTLRQCQRQFSILERSRRSGYSVVEK